MKKSVEKSVKRSKKKRIWIPVVTVIVLGIIAFRIAASGKGTAAAAVETITPVRGDLQESISTSGMVTSEEQKVYFAPAAGVLGEVCVTLGDAVKKGDLLVGYDQDALERTLQTARLQQTMSENGYESIMAQQSESAAKLKEADTNLTVLKQQITDWEAYLEKLTEQLNQNQRDTVNALTEEGFQLSVRAGELQKKLQSLDPSSEEYSTVSDELNEVSSAQSRNSYLQQIAASSSSDYAVKLQKEIDEVSKQLSEFKEYQAEMEAQKSASESSILNQYDRQKYSADKELSDMSYEQALEAYEIASLGITADFDGIVTELTAVEGETVAEGIQLLTLADSRNLKVSFQASKYDLEKLELGQKAVVTVSGSSYEGEVSKINRMAQLNESGTPMVGVEIHLSAPDEKIILGLDAKIEIYTHSTQNALLIPVEAVNADKNGDFLYVEENGIVVKKPVVCGISSESYTEILEGIDENTRIILSSYATIEEGMSVVSVQAAE